MNEDSSLPAFNYDQRLPGVGLHLPTRMSVLPLAAGSLALVSPVPIDDAMAREIDALGEVRFLIAPNLLHHLYLGEASRRYPRATILAPAGLRQKRPDLRIDALLGCDLPEELRSAVDHIHIAGVPGIDEHVFFHRASRTLVVTDLVFNITRPRGLAAHIFLFLGGCHGRLAQSRVWRLLLKDRAAASHSIEQLLSLDIVTLSMAHGEVVRVDAHKRLASALAWLRPSRRLLRE